MRTSLAMAGLAAALILATPAHAQGEGSSGEDSVVRRSGGLLDSSPQTRHHMLSFFAVLPWYYGFGVGLGVRYAIPIVPQGFIPKLNDSVELEFGADIFTAYYYDYAYGPNFGGGYSYTALAIPLEGRWTFHITDRFSAYGKAGVGWALGFGPYDRFRPGYGGGLYLIFCPGVLFKVSDTIALRAEVGNFGLRGGIGIAF